MSVFGGDSWGREAQHRKRRLDDLMLPSASSSSSSSGPKISSFKKLSNGKLACLVCPHNPVLDSPLMLSMHNKGSRHIAAESRLRERELSRQGELNKRLALSSDSAASCSSGSSGRNADCSNTREKPLIEQTRRAILEAQSSRFKNFSSKVHSYDPKRTAKASSGDSLLSASGVSVENNSGNKGSDEYNNSNGEPFVRDQTHSKTLQEWQEQLRKRQEQELRFIASGWRRDCHGTWYRDNDVEFDSDEEDPNVCLR